MNFCVNPLTLGVPLNYPGKPDIGCRSCLEHSTYKTGGFLTDVETCLVWESWISLVFLG